MSLTAVSLFAGIGTIDLGMQRAGIRTVAAVEIDPARRGVLARHFPEATLFSDVEDVTGGELLAAGFDPKRGVVAAGWPCFAAGTRILTERGWVPIEDVTVGELVLTHAGRWMPVTDTMSRTSDHTVTVHGTGVPGVVTTEEHPFYARPQNRVWVGRENGSWVRDFGEPDWTESAKLQGQFVSQVLPPVEDSEYGADVWWLVGRYLADGWTTHGSRKNGQVRRRVVICCARQEADDLEPRISRVVHTTRTDVRTGTKFAITQQWFVNLVDPLGHGAAGKTLTRRELALPPEKAEALLDGWLTGDGSVKIKAGSPYGSGTTVSRSLALSMALLAQRARGVVASVHPVKVPPTTVIEGRIVRQLPQYEVVVPPRNRSAFVEGDYGWKLVRRVIRTDGPVRVYNLSVARDESYVADGAIVHNCQGNSVAGRRGGMDDPRSGLWRHVVRILAETRARWFLGENVPGLYSVNRGRDIAVVRRDLAQLGYWWAERILDAQYFGVPQRRRRVFFVGHLGGDGAAPVQVLLEPEGSGGDSAAGGAAGPGVAVVAALSPSDGGADDNDGRGGRLIVGTLTTGTGGKRGWRVGADEAAAGHLVAAPLRAGNHHGDHAAAESHLIAGTLSAKWAKGTGGPSGDEAQNLVPVAFDRAQITSPESRANPQPGGPAMTLAAGGQPHVAYALRADPGGVGQGHNTNYVPVSLAAAGGISTGVDVAQTIRAGHSQSPGMVAAEAFIVDKERDRPNAAGINVTPTDVASTITARDPAEQNDRGLRIVTPAAVRRLTPTECERLQGVPDGWTELSDGKPQSDSARYRQLGDAAAVPVIEWIARRLVAVHEQEGEEPS